MKKIWNKSLLYALAVTTALGSIALPSSARAGKEGVFLANDTYFTLERVSVASGSSSLMQFTLKLHNGSSSVIDFNRYGVRVLDAAGNRYPARLTGKLSARVQPGADQEFPFYSELGNLPSAEGLKVDLFEWNGSGTDGIRDIGALNASVDVPAAAEPGTQAVISLQDADTSLDSEGFVTVKRGDAYETVESGKRYLYVDLAFKNDSGSDLTLPSALQYRLRDAQGYSYEGSLLTGDSSVLPPGGTVVRTVRMLAPTVEATASGAMSLQLWTDASGDEEVLASLPVAGASAATSLGGERALTGSNEGLTLVAEKAAAAPQDDETLVQTTITVRNDTDSVLALPDLTGTYQFGYSASEEATLVRTTSESYVQPKSSVTLQYSALLPEGIDPESANLVVRAQTGTASSTSGTSGTSSSSGTTSGTSTSSGTTASTGTSSSTGTGTSTASTSSSSSTSSTSTTTKATTSSTVSVDRPVMIASLKGITRQANTLQTAKAYTLGEVMPLEATSSIASKLTTTLVELHEHESEEFGYRTAIAKIKLTNNGTTAVSLPDVGLELLASSGLSYPGTRQTTTASTIAPGTSYVVSYSFLLADDAGEEETYALQVTDAKAAAPAKLTLGTYQVAFQKDDTSSDKISFYPFEVGFDWYTGGWLYSSGDYSYVLNMSLTVERKDNVIIDSGFSGIEFALVDSTGRVLSTSTGTFMGTQKLNSGKHKITFTDIQSEQIESGTSIHVYETVTTPEGTAKRLVKILK
ncbi:DUF4352 domain-containing protein [Paenibacillus caseinilyticus]|uniref:DUF4352 domain-containing protein n=1 Tax=Paenibacillus mucilaginosus TaxID=61624 RepID=UPI0002592325|nr:DUF4352 domain-containing protein [Paenibacillus mucilaginosus]